MTDFLTSISERNFGAAATIRPRLNSRFEPSAAPARFTEMSDGVLERQSGAPERAAVEHHQLGDSPTRAREKFTEDTIEPNSDPNSGDALSPKQRLPLNSQELEQAAITPRMAANLADVHPRLHDGRLKKDTVARQNDREEHGQHGEHTTAEVKTHEENLIDGIRQPFVMVVPRVLAESPLVSEEAVVSAIPFQELRPSETIPSQSLLIPQIPEKLRMEMRDSAAADIPQRSLAARLNRGTRKASAGAEPDVHVTIGRIEVRANAEAPSPNRSARVSSPEMTLDEYLRRHRQRGGR